MTLSQYVYTFGQSMLQCYGERVHKVALDVGLSCPNRDGSKGRGGCTFCNNSSFSPNGRKPASIAEQIENGRQVIKKRTGAKKFIAYFQAYSNTYAEVNYLQKLYNQALSEPDVIGLSIATRPDCVSHEVLTLLAGYRDDGYEIWLELGLQSAFNTTLERVNRGHGFEEYYHSARNARSLGIPVCTHLIMGLPGETRRHNMQSLQKVLDTGVDGLKFHPLHVVKGTQLANEWRRGQYQPLSMEEYISTVADLIEITPPNIVFHRLTGTASPDILLAPAWCAKKWQVLNGLEQELRSRQGLSGHSIHNRASYTAA